LSGISQTFSSVDVETQRCLDSIFYILKYQGPKAAAQVLETLMSTLTASGVSANIPLTTPYVNTIPVENEPEYPGNLELEKNIERIIRWNALAMVVKANREHDGLGGHMSTFASSAVLYEVAYNHFFKGNGEGKFSDQIFFQGHGSPGNYARSFLEGRLTETHLHNFRQELAKDGGLSSYPHPYLMPNYWQFPTVSMGLGPVMAIYQARFNRYLQARGLLTHDPKVWCFIGDGETDEPETLGALSIAARENLDNLIFVINCNLQRLDGPVRGNGKVIQDLEGVFRGAGWNVIKVIWGSEWDELLNSPQKEILIKRMTEAVDGEYQKYVVEPGSYIRKHFFGKYPELYEAVNHLTDRQLHSLKRGGHDPKKVYAAYHHAVNHKGQPTVILAKTVKGYGLGEAGEGKNISHQQKKLNEKELREFRTRFQIPIDDDAIVDTPFYKPDTSSPEVKYVLEQRKKLGGFVPERKPHFTPLNVPGLDFYQEFLKDSGDSDMSTTMAFVRILSKLIRHPELGKLVVPIIPDEGRTFGMEALFRQIGIYSPKGQLYEPVDRESLLYYNEAKDGQLLEEGINEVGAMSSFICAGTAYATHNVPTIPFYIYYSMFGFQRVGDLMWLAGDIQSKGFLLGGTAGRTTLNGEGLQHQDGHSHLIASSIPNLITYDTAFRYEIAVIVQDGLKRMYQDQENIFYYLTLGNENYAMPAMPEGAEEGILKGMYLFKKGPESKGFKAQILASGSMTQSALTAQNLLAEHFNVSADIWVVTSYKQLRTDALNAQRYNMLHPTQARKVSYLEKTVNELDGIFVAVSDNMKIVADQIAPWIPGGMLTLGTDGFGRSETRENLRRFFEVDAESICIATLYQLHRKEQIPASDVFNAIAKLGVDPEKAFGFCV
jgi:pyruvate dehydrogenase E1 component